MKLKILFFLIIGLLICNLLIAQNITNTLGTSGVFTIKDASNDYLTLNQSTGQVNLLKSLRLEYTTSPTLGVIFKGVDRFIHNYGTENTFLGINAGNFTMTGYQNTSVGNFSLNVNTTGFENTAEGNYSLRSNTLGYQNTSVGYASLYTNTMGSNNTAFGNSSLFFNTASFNTAVGSSALYSNSSGARNTAVGYQSLYSNTAGVNNSAFGDYSLFSNTTSVNNSAFGDYSLFSNITGENNSAFGLNSLYSNTTGENNSALGGNSLYSNTTGSVNTALGIGSGFGITTGNNNTVIGFNAQVPTGTSSNQVRIGNTFVTYAGVQVAWTITSDKRWKENILPSSLGLSFISKLNPVSYSRKNDESGKTEYGLIAQEVEEVLKESGAENTGMITITDEGMYELRYNDLLAPMVKAIQELSERLLEVRSENERLKKEIENLKSIEKRLALLELKLSGHIEDKEIKLSGE